MGYKFTNGRFEPHEFPHNDRPELAYEEWRYQALGYNLLPDLELGCPHAGFGVEVYAARPTDPPTDREGTHLVEVTACEYSHLILCPALPDLLRLLEMLSPTATATCATLQLSRTEPHVPPPALARANGTRGDSSGRPALALGGPRR